MQTVPITTHSTDCALLGQRGLSQNVAITRQHAAMMTATSRSRKPCGPTELPISASGIAPRPIMTTAMTRQILVWVPRAAKSAVSQ
jgi:hypothetical protein